MSTSLKLLIYPSITPEDEPPRLEGVKYVIKEEQLAITNSFRKNEALGQSRNNAQLRMSSSESKVQSCSSVQSLGHVWLFVTPWTAARQAYLSITSSQNLLKLMSIESVMPSNHQILYYPLLLLPLIFPSIRVFQFFASGGQSTWVSASASVLPMNI